MTQKYKALKNLFLFCSISCMVGPLLYYGIKAMIEGEPAEKFTLSLLALTAITICIINIACKIHLRSAIWFMILGIYICLDNIVSILIVIAICTILDEIVFTPLYKKYKELYVINREIDKR